MSLMLGKSEGLYKLHLAPDFARKMPFNCMRQLMGKRASALMPNQQGILVAQILA